MKTLYFENAGCENLTEYGELCACRIRTAYSLPDGRRVYCELNAWKPQPEQVKYWNKNTAHAVKIANGSVYAVVSSLHYITDRITADGYNADDENGARIIIPRDEVGQPFTLYPWTAAGICALVNELSGANFGAVVVLPWLSGYRVFKDNPTSRNGNTVNYNYGDEFIYNAEQTARRIAKRKEVDEEQRKQYGRACNSFYVDDTDADYCIIYTYAAGIPTEERTRRVYIPA